MFISLITNAKMMWRAAPVASIILALALASGVFFGGRMVAQAIYWNDPDHIDQALAGWMTPRYIAHSWDIPREQMVAFIGEQSGKNGRVNLTQIAQIRGLTLEQLITQIEIKLITYREAHPTKGGNP